MGAQRIIGGIMKKRLIACMIAAAICTSLTACGSQKEQTTPPEDTTITQDAPTGADNTPAGDDSAPTTDQQTPQTPATPLEGVGGDAAPETEAAGEELTDDSIGPVVFTPNERGYSLVYGSNVLHAYFKRLHVIPGDGKMTVRRMSDDTVVEEINLKDTEKCQIAEPDSTFSLVGWENGTHLTIRLSEVPASGESYYVNLEDGAFTSGDGAIRSKAIIDSTSWSFGVAPYGIIPALPDGSDVLVGDVLSADILVRQPAVLAKIENYDENRVRFNDKEFKQDAKLEIKIYQIGEDPFTVTFFDDDDNPLGSITLSYTASMPPQPEEEAPKKSITNL